MELKAQYAFDAPVTRVWDHLMDPATIAACLPGCQRLEPAGDDRYSVRLTAGVAAITGTFEGTISIADKQRPSSYRLIVEAHGRPGFANGEATIALSANETGAILDVTGTATVGGLVAQVGQRLLAATARMMMDRFFRCLRNRIADSG
jgi:uncharacterized protein